MGEEEESTRTVLHSREDWMILLVFVSDNLIGSMRHGAENRYNRQVLAAISQTRPGERQLRFLVVSAAAARG